MISIICLHLPYTTIIIQVLVLSKIDYSQSLLLGILEYQLNKLKIVQNIACQMIGYRQKYDHMTQDLMDLHWLKI